MKKVLTIFAMAAVLLVSCKKDKEPAAVAVTGVTLSETSITLVNGETKALEAAVLPENATNKNLSWSVDDDTIISVDTEGNVTALSTGMAVVTVVTEEGGFQAECDIHVINPTLTESIIVDKDGNPVTGTYVVTVGDEFTFSVKLLPDNYDQMSWNWSYDLNQDVLQFTEGESLTKFKAVKAGKVTLTAEPETYGPEAKIASVEVEVRDPLTLTLDTGCTVNVYGGGSTILSSNYPLTFASTSMELTDAAIVKDGDKYSVAVNTGIYTNKSGQPVNKEVMVSAIDDAGRTAEFTLNVLGWKLAFADKTTPNEPFDFENTKLYAGQQLIVAIADVSAKIVDPTDLPESLLYVHYSSDAYDVVLLADKTIALTVKAGAANYDFIVYNIIKYALTNSYTDSAILTCKSAGIQ